MEKLKENFASLFKVKLFIKPQTGKFEVYVNCSTLLFSPAGVFLHYRLQIKLFNSLPFFRLCSSCVYSCCFYRGMTKNICKIT